MTPPIPPSEERRLNSLHSYRILDTPMEPEYDDLVSLASYICQTPFAQISFIDKDRQWIKAKIGHSIFEAPRDTAFCAYTVLQSDRLLEVPDAKLDPRFAQNPAVISGPLIRFYAGAPLISADGESIGALCVMDRTPRDLTPAQRTALNALSRSVTAQLELRRRTAELVQLAGNQEVVQNQLRKQFEDLKKSKNETQTLLDEADRSRRVMLSLMEDERRNGQDLKRSEQRFRRVVETIREVFWIRDVETSRIIYVSPAFEEIWGRASAELYASAAVWNESLHPADRDRLLPESAGDSEWEFREQTYRIVRPNGAIRWIRSRVFPAKDEGSNVTYHIGVAEDITDRKQLEEQFLHAQRMEAVGALASGVAHDLNNILAPILLVSSLLKESAEGKDRELLGLIESNGQRGAAIIKQLLTFGREIAGERETLQPAHLIRDMMKIMQATFPRNLVVKEFLGANLPIIEGDPTQLHQVIMNLCVNARDAMPDGGTLTLEAKNRTIGADEPFDSRLAPGPYVLISVKDTGHGIPPDVLGKIFEPFYTTKGIGKGTGLGLSTVVGIVKSHGGVVKVSTEPGKGSAFDVYLPAAKAQSSPATPSLAQSKRGNGELLLLIDDEVALLKATSVFLEAKGYRVIVAESGESGLNLFLAQQSAIRAIVTDLMMPGMGGLAFCRAVRGAGSTVKIIAISGLVPDSSEEISKLSLSAVLAKPFAPALLLDAIAEAVSQS